MDEEIHEGEAGREGGRKRGEIDLSGVKQAKLSRAEEWTDKQRTKEVRGGRLAGGEDGEAAKREEKKMETAMGREGKGRGGRIPESPRFDAVSL